MISSPCCRIVRSYYLGNSGTFHSRLAALCPSYIKVPNSHARIFVTKLRQTNRPHSSFIIDTKKTTQRVLGSSKVQTDLDDILKDQSASVQLKLVDAYRKGFQSSTEKEKASKKWETLVAYFAKFVVTGVCLYCIFKVSNKMFGGAFPKVLDPSVASFAENADVNFGDVQGCDEVKKELQDIVEFLRNPEKFNHIGAKLPKGVLLVGPPGVGKTLLAKAVSGEAQVPFLYVSGSSFEEVFVGLGASRVRQLFAAAKQNSPCLIFIDEIDSVGRNRTSSPHHPYANQTINQLLAEMDGFQSTEGIIVLGATNQAEDLDKALLRPGRFDVQIFVSPPTYEGRMALLSLYLRKVKTGPNIDIEKLAHGTVGYTGADIQNLVNQAAIAAGLHNDPVVEMHHLWEARDRLIMGPAKRRPMDDQTNRVSAFHEAGHALVALLTPDSTPLHKVTIIPRGEAGGLTSFLQEKDMSFMTRPQLLAQLDVLMGGRVGEELAFGTDKVTTGAADDFRKATALAQNMVKRFGFSSKIGPRVIPDTQDEHLSQTTRDLIDKEVDQLLNDSLTRVRTLLSGHNKQHKLLAEALLHFETLTKDEVTAVIAGKMKPTKIPSSSPSKSTTLLPQISPPTPPEIQV
ncbi:ATP-dependent zinc metalloprotease YME1 isoform 2 [Schistosoma japonicum]|uniref:ATP-dependent zinc metalloprotease YME1 isoform 2 n=2 Tax=Schistosoma japonicum TaxID=6182 RepID=C1L6V5_SCHJA|nr:ATP-dependent zinc metalloprotease YME1 like [Schistosoma japonicum]TNN14272.1 ATP-dependent zinc metalloprotease YME1 isoform 2 [Schistosoma japonicum]CAX70433.1 YME1-Like (Mitochondrial Escape) AAA protease [Schistosoma japonicum]